MVDLRSDFLLLPSIAIIPQYFENKRVLAVGIGSTLVVVRSVPHGSLLGSYHSIDTVNQ